MKRIILVILAGICILTGGIESVFAQSTQSQQSTVHLFNGKNLSGWKIHGTEKWYVNNGELIC